MEPRTGRFCWPCWEIRCVEVKQLRLDDIDWRSPEIAIRRKARREDRMPLPAEVGQAVSAYLGLRGPGR
jgi:integrase